MSHVSECLAFLLCCETEYMLRGLQVINKTALSNIYVVLNMKKSCLELPSLSSTIFRIQHAAPNITKKVVNVWTKEANNGSTHHSC